MKAIQKQIANFPKALTDKTRKEALIANITAKKHVGSTKYDAPKVKETLTIQNNYKCAFCEDILLNSDKHIEHYRPKNEYFWLAFSWDNLLLACGGYNRNKGTDFKGLGKKASHKDYQHLSITELQTIGSELDKIENPLLVNPEKEIQQFFDENLTFTLEGEIKSNNERLNYTISTCKLYRDELVKKRLVEINELRNRINERKKLFQIHKDKGTYSRDIALVQFDLKRKLENDPPFSALLKYLQNNFVDLMKS